jgi:hypothetical protein
MGGLQLHLSNRQRAVRYRCSDETIRHSASHHLCLPGVRIWIGGLGISESKTRSALHGSRTDRKGGPRLGGDAVLPDAPTRDRGNSYRYHACGFHVCGCSLHIARRRVRSYSIRKAVPPLLNWDNPDILRVWGFGRSGRSPNRGKPADAVGRNYGAYQHRRLPAMDVVLSIVLLRTEQPSWFEHSDTYCKQSQEC